MFSHISRNINKHIFFFTFEIFTSKTFSTGAYNMGGSPEPAVARIKNMVYMNHTVENHVGTRDDFLGKFSSVFI